MPVVIQPNIALDIDQIPVERDIYDSYVSNTLDVKNLMVIGYMAISASTKHLQSDLWHKDINVIKDTYENIIAELRKDAVEHAETIIAKAVSDKDKDILTRQERFNTIEEKNQAILKNIQAEKDKEIFIMQERYNTLEERNQAILTKIQAEKEVEIAQLKEQLKQSQSNIDCIIATAVANKDVEIARLREINSRSDLSTQTELAVYNERIDGYKRRTQELEVQLHQAQGMLKENTMDMLKSLRIDEINALQAQINTLKGSNFSKGIVGENSVRKWLMESFNDCEIIDKSGCAAESDLHLMKPSGEFLAIECKNKSQITVQDDDKSLRDIAYMREKYGKMFIGYVFISLRSTNIPKKGSGCFELINDEIPVYWYGQKEYDDNDNHVIEYCKAVMTFATSLKALRCKFLDSDNTIDTFHKKLSEVYNLFKLCLERLNQNQKTIANLVNNAKQLQENNNMALQLLNDYIVANNLPSTSVATGKYQCPHCDRSFVRKADFTKHSSKCTSPI